MDPSSVDDVPRGWNPIGWRVHVGDGGTPPGGGEPCRIFGVADRTFVFVGIHTKKVNPRR